MSLIPKINICTTSSCSGLVVTEQTSPKSAANLTGWDASNILTTDIVSAQVEIFDIEAVPTLLQTIVLKDGSTDVYATVTGAPAPGSFLAFDNVPTTLTDGVFKIVYTVKDASNEYLNESQHILVTCALKACIAKASMKIAGICDSVTKSKIKEVIVDLTIALYGAQTSFVCGDFENVNTILTSAAKLCEEACAQGCGE